MDSELKEIVLNNWVESLGKKLQEITTWFSFLKNCWVEVGSRLKELLNH